MKSLKQVENRGTSVTIDLSSINDELTFVRTGVKNSKSFFESVLYCCINEYKNLNNQEKTEAVGNLYKIITDMISPKLKTEKIRKIFYRSKQIIDNENCNKLFNDTYSNDVYSLIFKITGENNLFSNIPMETTSDKLIQLVRSNFVKIDRLKIRILSRKKNYKMFLKV